MDGMTFEQIEALGRAGWLERLGKELHDKIACDTFCGDGTRSSLAARACYPQAST